MTKQTINIGTSPDDHTGDSLRVGGDKINDNFTELYDRGPVYSGTDYETLKAAIRQFSIKGMKYGESFYISKIIAGEVYSDPSYRKYQIDVNLTTSLGSAGTCRLRFLTVSVPVGTPKTGLEEIALSDPTSTTLFGSIKIDWSKLTLGATYTSTTWAAGALSNISTFDAGSTPGGGGIGIEILKVTSSETVTGAYDLYQVGAGGTINIDTAANIVGPIKIKNISGGAIDINSSDGNHKFDSTYTQIQLADFGYVEINVGSTNTGVTDLLVNGTYTTPP